MLHFIHGTLAKLTGEYAVIDCCGAGFKILISTATCAKIADKAGKDVLLYTYMSVSEDNISLHGFAEEEELELFIKLISVSGIGPKAATAILGALTPDTLRSAVAHNDARTIAQAPGVGLKTAQKLIIELKDKIAAGEAELPQAASPADNQKVLQVVDTLAVYGFARNQVTEAVKKLDSSLPLEELIAQTLRILGKEKGR
ncbi:MAG: Holliday junction branch migration protein RuvA [Clostridia bacterium]|nr:Holliday junction branch migration protein RuvA [Clostridia bacterium]